MGTVYLASAVNGACVLAFGFVYGILNLQTGFDVFDRRGDEGDGPASHNAGNTVADRGKLGRSLLDGDFELSDVIGGEGQDGRIGEKVVVEDATIEGEGAKHSTGSNVRYGAHTRILHAYTESINIQPTRGGVAPLYSPLMPSLRSVCITQWSGPLN